MSARPERAFYDARVRRWNPAPVDPDHEDCSRCGAFDAPFYAPDRGGVFRALCGLCCDVVVGLLPAALARRLA